MSLDLSSLKKLYELGWTLSIDERPAGTKAMATHWRLTPPPFMKEYSGDIHSTHGTGGDMSSVSKFIAEETADDVAEQLLPLLGIK